MQGLTGVLRIYVKHAAILLALGSVVQYGLAQTPGQAGAQDAPKRPRITGIAHVRLYASNLERSRAFYSGVLGLPASGGGCANVARACFRINATSQIELEAAPSPDPRNWVAEIAFATDDVAGMRRYLLAHGVAAGAISNDRGSSHFELRDPE